MSFQAGVAVVVGIVREFRALFDLFWCCSRCSGRCSEVVRVDRGVVRVSLGVVRVVPGVVRVAGRVVRVVLGAVRVVLGVVRAVLGFVCLIS